MKRLFVALSIVPALYYMNPAWQFNIVEAAEIPAKAEQPSQAACRMAK